MLADVACVILIAAGALCSLTWVVFLLAASPNSSPRQLRLLKLCMLTVAVGAAASTAGAIWLLIADKPWPGAAVAATPIAAAMGWIVVLSIKR